MKKNVRTFLSSQAMSSTAVSQRSKRTEEFSLEKQQQQKNP